MNVILKRPKFKVGQVVIATIGRAHGYVPLDDPYLMVGTIEAIIMEKDAPIVYSMGESWAANEEDVSDGSQFQV